MKRNILLPAACCALLLTGCSHMDTTPSHENVTTETTPSPSTSPQSGSTTSPGAPVPRHLVVYVPGSGGDGDSLVARPVAVAAGSSSPARAALEALTDASHGPLPEGTRLRSIKIDSGLATVDFSGELVSHFHGAEQQEAQTVNSVLRTLGQFSTIDRVQFLVDGKTVEALSQLPLAAPLDVIRSETPSSPVQTAATGHGQ